VSESAQRSRQRPHDRDNQGSNGTHTITLRLGSTAVDSCDNEPTIEAPAVPDETFGAIYRHPQAVPIGNVDASDIGVVQSDRETTLAVVLP